MRIEVSIRKTLRSKAREFHLDVEFTCQDDVSVIFGASGSGKSATLRAIAGLDRPDSGRIVVDGRVLFDSARAIDVPARVRSVGYVFQDYALFPHLTVEENVALPVNPWWRWPPEISASASDWRARSSENRQFCCSTNRSRRSIRYCVSACARSC